jgi:hypothetical protein
MKTSPTFTTIMKALLVASEQIGPIEKEGWNPDTKSRYASLNLVVEIVKPVLRANGILVVQGIEPNSPPGYLDVETTLVHAATGEWISNIVRLALVGRRKSNADGGGFNPPDPQASGSALTYGKRYGILAALFLVADEDDDGQGAKPEIARAVEDARESRNVGQMGQALVEGIMPVGGATQKGKPIADMPIGVLRQALQHCRTNGMRNEARIIATELTRRSLGGDKGAESTLRAAAAEDDNIADAAQMASEKIKGEQT